MNFGNARPLRTTEHIDNDHDLSSHKTYILQQNITDAINLHTHLYAYTVLISNVVGNLSRREKEYEL